MTELNGSDDQQNRESFADLEAGYRKEAKERADYGGIKRTLRLVAFLTLLVAVGGNQKEGSISGALDQVDFNKRLDQATAGVNPRKIVQGTIAKSKFSFAFDRSGSIPKSVSSGLEDLVPRSGLIGNVPADVVIFGKTAVEKDSGKVADLDMPDVAERAGHYTDIVAALKMASEFLNPNFQNLDEGKMRGVLAAFIESDLLPDLPPDVERLGANPTDRQEQINELISTVRGMKAADVKMYNLNPELVNTKARDIASLFEKTDPSELKAVLVSKIKANFKNAIKASIGPSWRELHPSFERFVEGFENYDFKLVFVLWLISCAYIPAKAYQISDFRKERINKKKKFRQLDRLKVKFEELIKNLNFDEENLSKFKQAVEPLITGLKEMIEEVKSEYEGDVEEDSPEEFKPVREDIAKLKDAESGIAGIKERFDWAKEKTSKENRPTPADLAGWIQLVSGLEKLHQDTAQFLRNAPLPSVKSDDENNLRTTLKNKYDVFKLAEKLRSIYVPSTAIIMSDLKKLDNFEALFLAVKKYFEEQIKKLEPHGYQDAVSMYKEKLQDLERLSAEFGSFLRQVKYLNETLEDATKTYELVEDFISAGKNNSPVKYNKAVSQLNDLLKKIADMKELLDSDEFVEAKGKVGKNTLEFSQITGLVERENESLVKQVRGFGYDAIKLRDILKYLRF